MCWPERGPMCLFGRSMKGFSYLRGSCPQLSSVWHPCSTAYLPTIPPSVLHPHRPGAYCDAALWDMVLHKTHVNLKLRDKVAVIWLKADTERWDCSASLHPAVVSAVTENRAHAEVAEPACWNLPDTYQSFAVARFGIIHFHSWNQKRVLSATTDTSGQWWSHRSRHCAVLAGLSAYL